MSNIAWAHSEEALIRFLVDAGREKDTKQAILRKAACASGLAVRRQGRQLDFPDAMSV